MYFVLCDCHIAKNYNSVKIIFFLSEWKTLSKEKKENLKQQTGVGVQICIVQTWKTFL